MSKKVEELLASLIEQVKTLSEENKKYKAELDARVSVIERKHVPVSLEQDVITCVQGSIAKALETSLGGYNSPLGKLAESVVESHKAPIRNIMNEAMTEAIGRDEFGKQMREMFVHRVARVMISGMEGQIEKASNELKQNPQFKAKATLAIANIVDEMSVKRG